jgi:Lecithin retinol acyltransferase
LEASTMNLGDHIRTIANGRVDHAIDCGDRTVIHLVLATGGAGRAEVRRSRLSDFTESAERVEVVTHSQRGYPPRMVVARAFSRLGDSAAWAMFPSAEHFATWCFNGQAPASGAGPAVPEPRAAPRKAPARKPARRKAPARPKARRPPPKGQAASRKAARKGTGRRR